MASSDPWAVARVEITPEAAAVLRGLAAEHGPLLFHQSGGCCDGSAPMCYPADDFRVGARDVLLGHVDGVPVYIGALQFDAWRHTHLLIDVVPGRGSGFSLEAPLGVRFLTRSGCSTRTNGAGSRPARRGSDRWRRRTAPDGGG